MKTYLFNIIPKLRQYSQELDNTALLTSHHWVVLEESGANVTYIFRTNGDLLISQKGDVQKAKWEYLGNHTLLIDQGAKSYLFKHGFFNESILALRVDGTEEYAVLVSELQYNQGLNSIQAVNERLEKLVVPPVKYVKPDGYEVSPDTVILSESAQRQENLQVLLIVFVIVFFGIIAVLVML